MGVIAEWRYNDFQHRGEERHSHDDASEFGQATGGVEWLDD